MSLESGEKFAQQCATVIDNLPWLAKTIRIAIFDAFLPSIIEDVGIVSNGHFRKNEGCVILFL